MKHIIDPFIPIDYMAHLLKHDSTYGRFTGEVSVINGILFVNGKKIIVRNE
jgi:glyceraldehyde 3-phosphate dehydrogenase